MPEEITTDDTFLSKSQWENDFDLLKDLDETTHVGFFPKIAPRILLDDASIDPSPINSRVNSQDVEMTSKSNFIKKNSAPSVVFVTPKKKRKIANVTNHQQEDMSLEVKNGKNSLFRKSVAGKENQGFNVGYAESEASNITTATEHSPEMTDTSLDLTLTDAIVNIKKTMFIKKKSSVNLQTSFNGKNDVGDESDVGKNTICKTVSMSTTEAALKYPKDAVSPSSPGDAASPSAPEVAVSPSSPGDANEVKNDSEPEISTRMEKNLKELQSSFASSPVVSSQDDSTTFSKPVLPFSRPSQRKKDKYFNVQCNETPISSSDSDKRDTGLTQDNDSLISTQSSQEETLSRANEKRSTLFRKRSTKIPEFDVNMETTASGTNVSSIDDSAKGNELGKTFKSNNNKNVEVSEMEESSFAVPASQEETLSQPNVKRNTLFCKKNTKEANFEVNFETTGSGNNASSLDNSTKKIDLTKTPGSDNEDAELSKDSPLSVPSSQENTLPRVIAKRSTLFNKRKTKTADFKVNFEETVSGSTNVSSVENSIQDNNDLTKNSSTSESAILSQKAKGVTDMRKSLFVRRSERNKEKSFNVPFEQTITASDTTSNKTCNEISLNASEQTQPSSKKSKVDRKTILFQKKSKDEDDPFNVSCNETNSFRNASKNDSLRRVALFGKRKKKGIEDTFDVACEESQVEKEPDESSTSMGGKASFNEKSLELSPLNVSEVKNHSHEKLIQGSPVSSIARAGSQRSLALSHTQNSSFSYSDRSRMSQNATVIDKTEKSIKTLPMISNRTLNSTQSSFNDDNLNGYMSDQSDNSTDEEPETVPTAENPSPIPVENPQIFPSKKGKSAPSNNIEKVTDWELKFQRIIEKSGKSENVRPNKSQPLPAKKKQISQSKRSPKPKFKKPAPFATKRLYKFLIDKLEPEFGIDAEVKAEKLVIIICETVKIVCREETYQKKLINDLKVNMAKLGIIETTWDFYEFIRNFLPDSFREKSIPRIQPFTCQVWPPQDVANVFDKIL